MNKKLVSVICTLLCLCLLLSACGGEEVKPSETETPEETQVIRNFPMAEKPAFKEESVYVNLRPDGSVYSVSVTDRLRSELPQVRVEDVSELLDITDVKTDTEPVYEDGRMYWDMEGVDLYYNGKSEAQPPISVAIKYFLDDREISAEKLAGKSGSLRIEISVVNNVEQTVNIQGSSCRITCPMMFAGGMLLPEEGFSDVKVSNGVIMSDGAHKLVAFVGIPGMNESLKLDSLGIPLLGDALTKTEYSVTAEVEDFAMGNMMFAAVPFSSLAALGGENSAEGIEEVKNLLIDIDSMLSAVQSMGLAEMAQALYGDAKQIEQLLSAVGEATKLYNENRALLDMMDKYVTEENLALLEKFIADVENLNTEPLQKLLNNESFRRLMSFLSELDKGLGDLNVFTQDAMQLMQLIDGLNSDLSDPELRKAVENLPQTVSRLKALLGVLRDCRGAIDDFSSYFSGDKSDTLKNLVAMVDKYANLSALTQAQKEHLAARTRAWLHFGQQYDIFTQKLPEASSSVLFIYRVDSV